MRIIMCLFPTTDMKIKWDNDTAYKHTHNLPRKWRPKRKGNEVGKGGPRMITSLHSLTSWVPEGWALPSLWSDGQWMLNKESLLMRSIRRRRRLPTCLLKESNILCIKSLKRHKVLMEMLWFQHTFLFHFNVPQTKKIILFYFIYYSFFKLLLVCTTSC